MFGIREFRGNDCRWGVGRHGRGRHGRGFGWGGRHGRGDGDDTMRAGRMLAQGDLRLIALALIAEQPRHGYDIIKVFEEKTSGWYSPSSWSRIRSCSAGAIPSTGARSISRHSTRARSM